MMSACCRRLLNRNWSSVTCKVYQRTLTKSIYLQPYSVNEVPALARVSATRFPATRSQLYATKAVDSTVDDDTKVVEKPPGIFKRFWTWLHSDEGEVDEEMSVEEKEERDEMLRKLQEMYFANPPMEPDLDFYKDTMKMLIKYNDRLGVDALWTLMLDEKKIEPDEELTAIVKTFLKRAIEEA